MSEMRLPTVGIDLGTTYSCVAYVDDAGRPVVVHDSEGEVETPSVVWFNGRHAYVGKKANELKATQPFDIFEFVKLDIGKPIEEAHSLYMVEQAQGEVVPNLVEGFKYGAAGISAIILRYLKKQVAMHFRKAGLVAESDDRKLQIDAIITVPAYFLDTHRQETKLAGLAAGFNVLGLVNEPTAAALAYGLTRSGEETILVFDLGGGTFDVTVLRMRNGQAEVLATRGESSLGGKVFDEVIQDFILTRAQDVTGVRVADEMAFEIQKKVLIAKHQLSESETARVYLTHGDRDLELTLQRRAPPSGRSRMRVTGGSTDEFYLEERGANLIYGCQALCEQVLSDVAVGSGDGQRRMSWGDIDQIVLVGGSCRMPMVAEMVERISGRPVRKALAGVGYDTAIAIGAALYAVHRARVKDVVSHGVGVKVKKLVRTEPPLFREVVHYLIKKNTPLPITVETVFSAEPMAKLSLYEGESEALDEGPILRGEVQLDNAKSTEVSIVVNVSVDGMIGVTADDGSGVRKELEIHHEQFEFTSRLRSLREKIQSIEIRI